MPFDQTTRNRLARFVGDARRLLNEEFTRQLQNDYGLDPLAGEVSELARLTGLDDAHRETATILRETLAHYLGCPVDKLQDAKPKERQAALDRISREQSFTVLNRLCAMRLAEARGILLPSISQGYTSSGFQLYARLAGPALGETGNAYRAYLLSVWDEFATELPTLFDRFSPQGRLFPREAALLALLDLLNAADLEELWAEDETIGWIYQYFNSKEERQAMRAESGAPRNSRELAVRNQFFTPRYVVEFLTDNTLGRIWYEMTQGQTGLKGSCRYLVRRPDEVFLSRETASEDSWLAPALKLLESGDESSFPPFDRSDRSIKRLIGVARCVNGYERYGSPSADWNGWGLVRLKGDMEARESLGAFTTQQVLDVLFLLQRIDYHNGGVERSGDWLHTWLRLGNEVRERALASRKPDLPQEELLRQPVFIPHRPLKDPRDITMLDPACGSMHFGLYGFDLYERIYEEAWDIEEERGADALARSEGLQPLHEAYRSNEAFLVDVPRLIIERNIHGIDIDPRAVQIAGLSLWLRAQRSWHDRGVKPQDRPAIRRANIVCAEPMPGDKAMLEAFLAGLQGESLEALMRRAWSVPAEERLRITPEMSDALRNLVRTVWQEMELAGEAGSLLKIEETLAGAIEKGRAEWEEKQPLFRVLQFGLEEERPGVSYARVISSDGKDFWDRAEGLVLAALSDYAGTSVQGVSYAHRFFAEDAARGFSFIDVCRAGYDVVLMNPPFGPASDNSTEYIQKRYMGALDLFACFLERSVDWSRPLGKTGAITTSAGFYRNQWQDWRSQYFFDRGIDVCADLGGHVLDAATVRASAYVQSRDTVSPRGSVFVRCNEADDKQRFLLEGLSSIPTGMLTSGTTLTDLTLLREIPGSPLAYWLPAALQRRLAHLPTFSSAGGGAQFGFSTKDDFRFLRLAWEVAPGDIGLHRSWAYISKGGEFSPYYYDIHLLVRHKDNLSEIEAALLSKYPYLGQSAGWVLHRENDYGQRGVTFQRRTNKPLAPRVLPDGCYFSDNGPSAFWPNRSTWSMLVVFNSVVARVLAATANGALEAEGGGGANSYEAGIINNIVVPRGAWDDRVAVNAARRIVELKQTWDSMSPDTRVFSLAWLSTGDLTPTNDVWATAFKAGELEETLRREQERIDDVVCEAYGVSRDEIYSLVSRLAPDSEVLAERISASELIDPIGHNLLSSLLGSVLGRWDVRYATGERPAPELGDPFAQLPPSPPGLLQSAQGLPLTAAEMGASYRLRISWQGILVDDKSHCEDIENRVRETVQLIWQERAELAEQKICRLLGSSSLGEHLRRPGLFFADHLGHYSKSRRQAPIYWPLSTPSNSYTLWLYYHRLTDQTLYTCVNDFVDPKFKQVEGEVARLSSKKARNTADERELERLNDLALELKDLRAELLRVAVFWKPNLNDGVQITAAPLWRLFKYKPWQKKLKETWEKLEAGDYDWAHLAFSIWPDRVREKCRTDKSLAIAHGLEELYVEPPAGKASKKRGRVAQLEDDEGSLLDE